MVWCSYTFFPFSWVRFTEQYKLVTVEGWMDLIAVITFPYIVEWRKMRLKVKLKLVPGLWLVVSIAGLPAGLLKVKLVSGLWLVICNAGLAAGLLKVKLKLVSGLWLVISDAGFPASLPKEKLNLVSGLWLVVSNAGLPAGWHYWSSRRIFLLWRSSAEEVSWDGLTGRNGKEQGEPVSVFQVCEMRILFYFHCSLHWCLSYPRRCLMHTCDA